MLRVIAATLLVHMTHQDDNLPSLNLSSADLHQAWSASAQPASEPETDHHAAASAEHHDEHEVAPQAEYAAEQYDDPQHETDTTYSEADVAYDEAPTEHDSVEATDWRRAVTLLHQMLEEGAGRVADSALRRAFERAGLQDGCTLVNQLRYFDFDASEASSSSQFRWYHHAKTFYSDSAFEERTRQLHEQAARAEQQQLARENGAQAHIRRSAAESHRLGTYVVGALADLYPSDFGPEDSQYAFDVQAESARRRVRERRRACGPLAFGDPRRHRGGRSRARVQC